MLLVAGLVFMAVASMATADEALLRIDSVKDKEPRSSVALIDSKDGWQFWGFGVNQPDPTLQVGRQLKPIKLGDLTVIPIAYLSFQTGPERFALDPWLIVKKPVGEGLLVAKLASRLPLDGTTKSFYSIESSLTVPIEKKWRIGVAATTWKTEGKQPWTVPWGPKVEWSGKGLRINALLLNQGSGDRLARIEFVWSQ